MDIQRLLAHLRATKSDRQVTRDTGVARNTVKRYRNWAQEQGLLSGPLPPLPELQQIIDATLPETEPPQNASTVEPYREIVVRLRQNKIEVRAIRARLQERGFTGSYSAI